MKENPFWDRLKIFLLNIPRTIQETAAWLIISYLIPLINIGIIWGIQGSNFQMTTNILSILITTNACFYTSLYYLVFTNKKERKLINVINVVAFVSTAVLFTVSIIEVEISKPLFSTDLYKTGALISFLMAFFLGLISKYDEVEALSRARADASKDKRETEVGHKKIKL